MHQPPRESGRPRGGSDIAPVDLSAHDIAEAHDELAARRAELLRSTSETWEGALRGLVHFAGINPAMLAALADLPFGETQDPAEWLAEHAARSGAVPGAASVRLPEDGRLRTAFLHRLFSGVADGAIPAFTLQHDIGGMPRTWDEAVRRLADRLFEPYTSDLDRLLRGVARRVAARDAADSPPATVSSGPVFHIETNTGPILAAGRDVSGNAVATDHATANVTAAPEALLASYADLVARWADALEDVRADQREATHAAISALSDAVRTGQASLAETAKLARTAAAASPTLRSRITAFVADVAKDVATSQLTPLAAAQLAHLPLVVEAFRHALRWAGS